MKKQNAKQLEFDFGDISSPASPAKKSEEEKPATELMKTVAARTMNYKNMEKVFAPEELKEISERVTAEQRRRAESEAKRTEYRRMKQLVKQLEEGNKSRLYAIPSISQGEGFYKMFGFSALYYAYRLAPRMGRSARVMKDSDKFSKMPYAASLVNMEKFKDQFRMYEKSDEIEELEDGMIIFTLKQELTDDELGELRMTEETRRDRLHNVLRPKAMEPAIFQAILMVIRQVAPRVRKLEKQYYYAIGEEMLRNLNRLLAYYFDYANGLIDKEEAGKRIMELVDSLFAALAILAEVRVWDYGVATAIGENVNELKRLTEAKFNYKKRK